MVFGADKLTVDANEVFLPNGGGLDLHPTANAEDPVAATCFSD